ncbi:hypothetical protein L1987_06152 [Smallanthus sonchifolius]|uniref:Uncharacterized protein n=1 Tax=Smallanthus sonchifolius TaxID=185202 RepID=A0ACB9JXC7_9ASTR|nr:hypothetical protein L1987_06152 [Smallanthus sonchifolius]
MAARGEVVLGDRWWCRFEHTSGGDAFSRLTDELCILSRNWGGSSRIRWLPATETISGRRTVTNSGGGA